MTRVQQIFKAAQALPKRKRAELAEMLLVSLDPPDLQPGLSDTGWKAEMTKRAEAASRPDWKGVPWKKALLQVRRELKTHRR